MRVAYVTTWGQPCGIATYTEELVEQLIGIPDVSVVILYPGEIGACLRETVKVPTIPGWARKDHGLYERLAGALALINPPVDVIHFQHEDGLFQLPAALLFAMDQLRKIYKVVITLHTVRWYGGWRHTGFYDSLRKCTDAIVVHTVEALASLSLAKGTAPIVRISHGTAITNELGDREHGLQLLGIPERFRDKVVVGSSFGFQSVNKNTVTTIRAFADTLARRLVNNAMFVICGDGETTYINTILYTIAESGYESRFHLNTQFMPVADIKHIMAALDFGVLNTQGWALSASGAAHVYARYGVPVAVANRPVYREAIQGGAVPFELAEDVYEPTSSMVDAIAALASSEAVRADVGRSLRHFAEETAWSQIAFRYVELYKTLLG